MVKKAYARVRIRIFSELPPVTWNEVHSADDVEDDTSNWLLLPLQAYVKLKNMFF